MSSTAEDADVKLADFGLSSKLANQYGKDLSAQCGTPSYMAPELVHKGGKYGQPVDCWALGITLYLMLAGRCPFVGDNLQDLFRRIEFDDVPFPMVPWKVLDKQCPAARDLVQRMLEKDCVWRYTAAEALQHPFLRNEPLEGNEPLPSVLDMMEEMLEDQHAEASSEAAQSSEAADGNESSASLGGGNEGTIAPQIAGSEIG